jgi:hypothetical protein
MDLNKIRKRERLRARACACACARIPREQVAGERRE